MARYHRWGLVAAIVLSVLPASGPAQAQEEQGAWTGAHPSPRPNWAAESNQAFAELGWAVASAGDVNGDGFDDVIVGAAKYDTGRVDVGRAFIFHGSATGISRAPNWTALGSQENSQAGWSVATAGDVNGDGYDEVIVGAPYFGAEDEGRASLYYGSAAGSSPAPGWTVVGDKEYGLLGSAVGTAGDVNGDGYDDVIVGATSYSENDSYEGAAFVYMGSASGLGTLAAWRADGGGSYDSFGWAAGTGGDVNGDGYDDVIVGAGSYSNGEDYEGSAYVFHGSAAGLSTTPNWTTESNHGGAYYGSSVGTAGDVNGDGYGDVIVGGAGFNLQAGRANVYHGSAGGLSQVADWSADPGQPAVGFGYSVSTAGDVNGDGYADVIVGAPYYNKGRPQEGKAIVYHGSATGLSATIDWWAEGNQASAWLGWSVSTAGDVNGDARDDVIIGAKQYGHPQASEGIAVAYYGEL